MHNICDSCETVQHCSQHGCIPLQPLKPCRSPYCECTPGTCSHPGCYDARGEPFKHPAPAEKPYTAVRNAWTGKATYTCNTCGETDFRSEHAARFHICEPPVPPAAQRPWVGLTDEQVTRLCKSGAVYAPDGVVTRTPLQYREELENVARTAVRKAEAKLRENNT
jgi:hypothetical protein